MPRVHESADGRVLLKFKHDAGQAERADALRNVGGEIEELFGFDGREHVHKVRIGDGFTVDQAAEQLAGDLAVDYAEQDYLVHAAVLSNDTGWTTGRLWGMAGDASSPANQFGSQAAEAWGAGYTGSTKVAVGVIDSGVDYTHPDLYLNIWLNQAEIPTALRQGGLVDADGDGLITFRDLNNSANAAYVSDVNGNGRIDGGDLLNDTRWERRGRHRRQRLSRRPDRLGFPQQRQRPLRRQRSRHARRRHHRGDRAATASASPASPGRR